MTWTQLHDACEHLDAKCILQHCHKNTTDNNTRTDELLQVDDHGSTPLHILAWGNPQPELLQALISNGPREALSRQDLHGDTCLHVACRFPTTSVKIAKLLVEACPTLTSVTNKQGLMPLHVACRFAPRNEALIEFLVHAYPCALYARIKVK